VLNSLSCRRLYRSAKRREGVPSGEERLSSQSIQITKQNRSAGEPTQTRLFMPLLLNLKMQSVLRLKKDVLWGNQYSVRPPDEHTIWRSEVKRKVVAGGVPKDTPSDMSIRSASQEFIKNYFLLVRNSRFSRNIGTVI
jgi:hypothetical protein